MTYCCDLTLGALQVVGSFQKTMRIPWPSSFHKLSAIVNVANLNILQLKGIGCIEPNVSFYPCVVTRLFSVRSLTRSSPPSLAPPLAATFLLLPSGPSSPYCSSLQPGLLPIQSAI